jgi:hypothetical protein
MAQQMTSSATINAGAVSAVSLHSVASTMSTTVHKPLVKACAHVAGACSSSQRRNTVSDCGRRRIVAACSTHRCTHRERAQVKRDRKQEKHAAQGLCS